MKEVHQHFSKTAHEYEDLRITDIEPILFIKKLRTRPVILSHIDRRNTDSTNLAVDDENIKTFFRRCHNSCGKRR